MVNHGGCCGSETSDWGMMELMTWERALSAGEMEAASEYGMDLLRYGNVGKWSQPFPGRNCWSGKTVRPALQFKSVSVSKGAKLTSPMMLRDGYMIVPNDNDYTGGEATFEVVANTDSRVRLQLQVETETTDDDSFYVWFDDSPKVEWDAGVRANAQQPRLFVGMILILIFAEALGLYGLIVGLVVASTAEGKGKEIGRA